MKTSFIYLPVSRVLAIVIWGWETKSASRPLMGFGELNDNMIKGLMFYLRYHEQGFICISLCVLSHVSRNQIKESLLLKVKHVVMRNEKQVFMKCWYMIFIHGLTNLKNIWDIKLLKILLQGFMELSKKRRHTLMCYILVLYMEVCNAWNMVIIHDYKAKTSTLWGKIEMSAHVLLGGF